MINQVSSIALVKCVFEVGSRNEGSEGVVNSPSLPSSLEFTAFRGTSVSCSQFHPTDAARIVVTVDAFLASAGS